MEQLTHIRRYVLVPTTGRVENAALRRFRLARVATSPRSALGVDRHARLERVAGMSSEPAANGGDPVRAEASDGESGRPRRAA